MLNYAAPLLLAKDFAKPGLTRLTKHREMIGKIDLDYLNIKY